MERLRRSFAHLPGIGAVKERKFWDDGILDWEQLRPYASPAMHEQLDRSEEALRDRNLAYFAENLPREALWRLLPGRLDRVAYLDIETTGTGFPPRCHSTTITFYLGGRIYQEHEAARKAQLIQKMLAESDFLCTFYGQVFDVPFLEREFKIDFKKPHLDLCFWLKRHGFKGGLKKIEKLFASIPARQALDLDGYDAVRLWRLHTQGVEGALETLLTYNAEDTVVLEQLLVEAFNLELPQHPVLALDPIGARPTPGLTTQIHTPIYHRLRGTGSDVQA